MTSSFAAYASQFISRNGNGPQASSAEDPMFFSFTTASDGDTAGLGFGAKSKDSEQFDLDDPHLNLRASRGEEEDPFSQLDRRREEEEGEEEDEYTGGWLAHQLSPLRDEERNGRGGHQRDYDEDEEDEGIGNPKIVEDDEDDDPIPRQQQAISLSTSLLPPPTNPDRFNLPDPRYAHLRGVGGRRKYNDSAWTALWLCCLSACYLSALVLLFTASSSNSDGGHKIPAPLPYPTHLHTIPLLVFLSLLSALAAYTHIALLRWFLRPVVWVCALATPVLLLGGALWAWAGSFVDEDEGDATGLRVFSLLPLLVSLYLFYRLYTLYTRLPALLAQLTSTERLLSLTTRILSQNPFLLALSPCLLLIILLGSIPFGTVVYRLLLIGYTVQRPEGWEYHVKPWAHVCLFAAVGIWMWSWGVVRGLLRVVCAGVVGAWYFDWQPEGLALETDDRDRDIERGQGAEHQARDDTDLDLEPPDMFTAAFTAGYTALPTLNINLTQPAMRAHTRALHASFYRATNDSLGSIALSSLILASIRSVALLLLFIDNVPSYFSALGRLLSLWSPPPLVSFAARLIASPIVQGIIGLTRRALVWAVRLAVGYLGNAVDGVSRLALVWVGMTGRGFWDSARRVGAVESDVIHRSRETDRDRLTNRILTLPRLTTHGPPPLSPLVTHTPLTLVLPFALTTYFFVAHTLGAPHQALGAAVLAAGVSAGTGVFCVGVVRDVGDAVWVCYLLGEMEKAERQQGGEESGESGKRKEVREVFEIKPNTPNNTRNRAQGQTLSRPSRGGQVPPQHASGSSGSRYHAPTPTSLHQALREPLLVSPPPLDSVPGLGAGVSPAQTRQQRKPIGGRGVYPQAYPTAMSTHPEYSAYPAYHISDSEDEDDSDRGGQRPRAGVGLGRVPEEISVRLAESGNGSGEGETSRSRVAKAKHKRNAMSKRDAKPSERLHQEGDDETDVDPFTVDPLDREHDVDGDGDGDSQEDEEDLSRRDQYGGNSNITGLGSGSGFGGLGHLRSMSGSGSGSGSVGGGGVSGSRRHGQSHSRLGSGSGSLTTSNRVEKQDEEEEEFFPGSGLFGSQ